MVDLDGVICNMIGGYEKALGIKADPWPMPGEYWACTALNLPEDVVEAVMVPYEFWANLNPYPYAHKFIQWLEDGYGQENVFFLTKPKDTKECWGGKFTWVQKNFPSYTHKLLTGVPKYCTAHSNSYLIDDCDENCDMFLAKGGNPIMFPQPWNRKHKLSNQKFEVVRQELISKIGVQLPEFKL